MLNYEHVMQEVDRQTSTIDINGKTIISDCKMIIIFLQEKLSEFKTVVELEPFNNKFDEIDFFRRTKPKLLGQLIYFRKMLRIENQRPLGEDMLDKYYLKKQEEIQCFFERHIAFYQYYKSGNSHLDEYYFLRKSHTEDFDIQMYHFDENPIFSTGYDHLAARILAMEMLHTYVSSRRYAMQQPESVNMPLELLKMNGKYRWTGSVIELVELIYGLNEMKSINGGDVPIQELTTFIATILGIEVKDCYSGYTDMKRRKSDSRTYFLDRMREHLSHRMKQDEEREKIKKR